MHMLYELTPKKAANVLRASDELQANQYQSALFDASMSHSHTVALRMNSRGRWTQQKDYFIKVLIVWPKG